MATEIDVVSSFQYYAQYVLYYNISMLKLCF